MPKLLEPSTAAAIRADLAAAQQPSLDRTFIDRIAALERAVELLLQAIER